MKLGAVILAAGAGTRLGGVAKALLRIGNENYLERIVRTARLAGTARFVVVIGRPHGHEVGLAAREMDLGVIVNPMPERGMASSVALGFSAIGDYDLDAAWLWPVDHPDVELSTLNALIANIGTAEVAQPRFEDRGGHPPLIARAVFPRLARCAGLDGGARAVLATSAIVQVAVEDDAVIHDVDTPADMAEIH
ncbi:hypothetical protein BH11MYX3_BH11MYX3_39710 [soil metagenome]